MNAKTLYCDESGFTGYNLLDSDQPFFAIASSSIDPQLAESLLLDAFPNYKAKEFKFSNIIKSSNEPGLEVLFRNLIPYIGDIFLYVIDKEFAAFAKMVDFLVEPAITMAGYDFYADGFCRRYSNYIYFGLNKISSKNIYPALVRAYVQFSRKPSLTSLKTLVKTLKVLCKDAEMYAKPFLEEMYLGAKNFRSNFDLDTFRNTNDIYLTSMLAIIGYWRKHSTEDFIVMHDSSSHFMRQREIWESITSSIVPSQLHPFGESETVTFPLRVLNTVAINSAENFTIQLCDLLAGFACYFFRNSAEGVKDRNLQKISSLPGFSNIKFNGIMPTNDFPTFPPKPLVGPDAVDLMIQIMHRK